MKYLIYVFAFILFSLNPLHLKAQSISETVNYINNFLKTYNYNMPKSIIPDAYYGHIEVDSNGLIAKYVYEHNSKEGKLVKIPDCHGYLKSFDTVVVSSKDSGAYFVSLVCPEGNKCLFKGHGNIIPADSTGMGFLITNLEVRNKIEQALKHLLVLAKNNSTFYSKDPINK
jgi:hypothetical protein